MQMSVHLNFGGNCEEAFAFYQKVFGTTKPFMMKYGEAPPDMPVDPNWKDKVMHTSIPMGDVMLMGCDAPPGRATPLGGFQVAVSMKEESEVKRIYDALQDGGSVQMPLMKTFWSPLFGMCTDKFGVAWMVTIPGQPA